ncbi:hypothetical protein Ciccas_011518 [Cichlidogyrus casuarinus]|uniref:Uncharacterized protein n=1 Tax=Cichlidogyrus casuarinus TaxID=1844966 RepID=A0ABD2PT52_9PLAT
MPQLQPSPGNDPPTPSSFLVLRPALPSSIGDSKDLSTKPNHLEKDHNGLIPRQFSVRLPQSVPFFHSQLLRYNFD